MNSLFDPECHRQVLGNRQEAKEQKQGGRKERVNRKKEGGGRREGPRKVGQAVWPAQRRKEPPDSTGARTVISSPSPDSQSVNNNQIAVIYTSTAKGPMGSSQGRLEEGWRFPPTWGGEGGGELCLAGLGFCLPPEV